MLSMVLTHKNQPTKTLNTNISASLVETFARLIVFDPDNFVKYLTRKLAIVCVAQYRMRKPTHYLEHVWQVLTAPTPQSNQTPSQLPSAFVNQQVNLLIELISFRLKNLTFTHRTSFVLLLNNLFSSPVSSSSSTQPGQPAQAGGGGVAQQQQPSQAQVQPQQQQQGQPRVNSPADVVGAFMKHHIIYVNAHCAFLKLLSSFSGSDFYELLNSISTTPSNKHGPKYFVNAESEEINKAVVMVIARAVHLTSNRKASQSFERQVISNLSFSSSSRSQPV